MTELLECVINNYVKIGHYFEGCFILMINEQNVVNQQKDKLCKYWYLMAASSPQKVL